MRRRLSVSVAAAIGGVIALVLALPATAAPKSATTTSASITGSATTAIGQMTVNAHNLTGSPGSASGTFTVNGDVLPVSIPGLTVLNTVASFTFSGPVTCLNVSGNRAGLIYPITTALGPVGSAFKGEAVYVTVQDNGPNQPEQVGFVGPAPLSSLKSCPALVPFLTVESGHITITPAH